MLRKESLIIIFVSFFILNCCEKIRTYKISGTINNENGNGVENVLVILNTQD